MKAPDNYEKTPQGQCPQCKQLNPYTVPVCQWCGARLPWASGATPTPPPVGAPQPPVSLEFQSMPGQTPYNAALATPKRKPIEYFLIGCALLMLLSIALCMLSPILSIIGFSRAAKSASQAATRPLPTSSSGQVVIDGPKFADVDAVMDGRVSRWTDAQKEHYWSGVKGKTISWTGEVMHLDPKILSIRCNPQSFAGDVFVTLDETQTNRLHLIRMGQRITIIGSLQKHGSTGYNIHNGHIVGL